MIETIVKRNGAVLAFDAQKIVTAVGKAMGAVSGTIDDAVAHRVADRVVSVLEQKGIEVPTVENVQDEVEAALMEAGETETAKAYIIYRRKRELVRQSKNLNAQLKEVFDTSAQESDLKRDNANVDGDCAMGTMLQVGAAASKSYYAENYLTEEQRKANQSGDIHIHDFDFYALTETCCQIDLLKLFHNGFSTGHGFLREPQGIQSYAALACIAIQSNQNDQHGGQSVPNFDYAMAEGVRKTYAKEFGLAVQGLYEDTYDMEPGTATIVADCIRETGLTPTMENHEEFNRALAEKLAAVVKQYACIEDKEGIEKIIRRAHKRALKATNKATHQAMEGVIHNLNTMHSRAGAQVPFSSINYGTDISPEGRMAIRNVLQATMEGLGNGETPIFPIQIFKVKEGVNYNEGDPNYDLFKYSMKVSAKRLFPNYSFIDSPFNLQYYVAGHPETEVTYMGCRTRSMGNVYDPATIDDGVYHPNGEVAYGRGNLSFTSINLPRLAILADHNEERFFESLTAMMELVARQLLDRLEIQSRRKAYNYPFLMGQGVWRGSEKLRPTDEVREVLKNGSLSIGFIGLAETLTALYGHHHGESDEMQQKGLAIVKFMRDFCDRKSREAGLNFALLATPAEGLSGYFVRKDKQLFGIIPGVTDKEYYTNSFHIPVYYPISAYEKIQKEAPYHALTNGGHITYVELDGDVANNIDAFESVIRCMHDKGIGYGSVNHPVDRDPVCGYVGIIGDVCPRCGRRAGEGLSAEKLEELRKQFPDMPYFHGLV